MGVSSFYGLQTSLRGLLAQQRLLDTAGHNIANASTQGYSRQQVDLQAAPALEIPAGGIVGGAGAHLGAGVDIVAYRRVRDQFVDLQFRAQNTNLGEWAARTKTLDRAELTLNEPGENGINRALMRQELSFLSHLTRLLGGDPEPGYRPPGASGTAGPPPVHRALDLQA